MKIGFTGTRHGMTVSQLLRTIETIKAMISEQRASEFHSGDCVGADEQIVQGLKDNGLVLRFVSHPPDEDRYRAFSSYDEKRSPLPYLDRNKAIVDETDVLIVAPLTFQEERRSGTWSTYRYAKKKGKRIIIVYPDGTEVREFSE